jgi:hypothetical protein
MQRARANNTGANILLHDGHDRNMGSDRTDTLRTTEALLTSFAADGIHPVTVDAWG